MRTKYYSKRIRTLRRRRLALALVTIMAAPMAMAQSLPDTGNVTSGSATIGSPIGQQMTITQTSKGAIIDWGSFNIATGYGVTFDQQFGPSSVTLNRVIGYGNGATTSMINGTLTSNGNVFIINPAGIVFGSGSQVNVGGLVASTLAIDNANFLSGVDSGQYNFTASGSVAGAISNNGQLTAADGGTIGLIGSKITNAGTITANNGSVVFGATSQVTLDYFGDGLTQVTVAGNGLGIANCSVDCNGGITSSGNVFARGGHIEMRSNTMDGASAGNGLFVEPANGGRIWIGGNVAAQTSGSRRGSVIIDAGMGNIDLGGMEGRTGNVSANGINAGEDAGTIELRGNQLFTHLCFGNGSQLCVANNRLGLVNASAFGAGGSAGEIHIDVNRLYHGGVLVTSANDGSGGLIDISADNAEIYNRIFAYGNNGDGGTINIDANSVLLFRGQQPWLGGPGTAFWSASLLAYGTTTGGAVNIDTGSLVVTDLGNVVPQFEDVVPVINVTGQLGGNGGTININAGSASIGDTYFANASGDGEGGIINIASDDLLLDGGLVSTGGTTGGDVTTTTTGSMFVGSTAYVNAGTWLVHAPSVQIMPTASAVSGAGALLTDDALSSSLDGGTVVQLYADGALGSGGTGNIQIGDGVNIVHSTATAAALELRATAGISGSNFSMQSIGGPLGLSFTANTTAFTPPSPLFTPNALATNPAEGYVSFTGATLISNGGDIALSGDGQGVYLESSQLSSGAGDIAVTGTVTDSGSTGVSVNSSVFNSTSGDVHISGLGGAGTGLTIDSDSSINAGSGLIELSASNDGSSDAIILQGSITSTSGVNLRPFNEADTILLGAGNGFSLSSADMAMIDAPVLVIGSAGHAGAIRVMEAVDWDNDLTLQNEGGTGGIDIQAAVDVGDNILTLASGGDISQTLGGGITAHSLLAIAGGDVALTAAQNNVAASSLAGSAGGDFAYEDVDALAIGEVSSFGFNPLDNIGLFSLSATGIAAGGNVFVRTASSDLTLGANVSGAHIDLVAAGLFFNPAGATLTATNGWRIYASTPDGEERGGLQGDGQFDVFGCSFGDEVCTGLGEGNQFIYQERRLLLAPVAPESIAEWLDEDELDSTPIDLLVAGACPVADAGDLLQSVTGKDELAQEWMKSRRRLQLSNCIDSKNAPGCRF